MCKEAIVFYAKQRDSEDCVDNFGSFRRARK